MLITFINFAIDLNSLYYYCIFFFFFAFLGLLLSTKNLVHFMIFVELLYLVFSLLLVISGQILENALGEVFSLIIVTIAAAEAAIGFSLFIIFINFKKNGYFNLIGNFNF